MQGQSETSVGVQPSETAVSRLSLLLWAGIIAVVYWSVTDVLLIGFVQTPERYPLFSQTLTPQLDGLMDFAVLMQTGLPEWPLWDVLPVTFSAVLYLAAAFDVYRLIRPRCTARVDFAMLFFGYTLSPLGHAGFYFAGIAAKVLLNAVPDGYPPLLALLCHFYRMLAVHWVASVGSIAAGRLLLLIQTLRYRTLFPRATTWRNPLPVGTVITVSYNLFPQSPVAAALGGAAFNLAQLVFFAYAVAYARRRGMGMQPDRSKTMPPLLDGDLRLDADACSTDNPPFHPKPIIYHSVVSSHLGQLSVFRRPPLSKPLGKKTC